QGSGNFSAATKTRGRSAGPLRVTSESLLRSVEPPRSRWHRTHSPQPTRSEVSPAPHAPSRTVLTRVVPAMRQSKPIAFLRGLPSVALRSDSPIRQGESNPPTPCQPHRGDTDRQTPLRHSRRKNTRLNSSHVAISYAVFCLKKKKNIDKDIV